MKTCSTCKEQKPLSEFNSDKRKKDGKYYRCKSCHTKVVQNWQRKNPEKVKNARWVREFGVSFEFVQNLKEQQDSKCAICKMSIEIGNKSAHIDHCHSSGKVRGLLCQKCNQGLGLFKDSVIALESAIEYLNKHATML